MRLNDAMTVRIAPVAPTRDEAPVEVGNVYISRRHPAAASFRIVVGMAYFRTGRKPFNNVLLLHVDDAGEVVGCSREPQHFISKWWDLIGRAERMPSFDVTRLKEAQHG